VKEKIKGSSLVPAFTMKKSPSFVHHLEI